MAHIFNKGLKGGAVMAAVVSIVFTIVAGPIVGGVIACATGLICGGGGGGTPVSGGQVAPNAPCNSAPNACGQTNLGFFVPAACSNNGNGDQEDGGGPASGPTGGSCIRCNASPPDNSSCPAPTIPQTNGYYANPSIVGVGKHTTLFWNVANATDCQLSGDNGFSTSGTGSGSTPTNALAQTTTFTLTCKDGDDGPSVSKALRVLVSPRYREL